PLLPAVGGGATLDALGQGGFCALVAGVLLGDFLVARANDLLVDGVAGHAVALLGEFQVRHGRCGGQQADDGRCRNDQGFHGFLTIMEKRGSGQTSAFILLQTIADPVARGLERDQCATDSENRFMTRTPAMISAMPMMAGGSSVCLCQNHATRATSTMPTPDHTA